MIEFKFKMSEKNQIVNIALSVGLVYTSCVYFTLDSERKFRLFLYRMMVVSLVAFLVGLNYKYFSALTNQYWLSLAKKAKVYFGYKEEEIREDKVRTFIE